MTTKEGYGTTTMSTAATPTPTNVQVIAPATLESGYTFDAMYEGITFQVVVPDGGVIKGQRFIVPFNPPPSAIAAVAVPADGGSVDYKQRGNGGGGGSSSSTIPTGIWRDGLCDCCAYGPCHAHFCMTLFLRPILLGQILTRMKMTWLGERTHTESSMNANDSRVEIDERWRSTFRNIVIVTVLFYGVALLTATPNDMDMDPTGATTVNVEELSDIDKIKYMVNSWLSSLFGLYVFYIMVQMRATLRHVYSIPQESCLCWYQLGICGNNPREGLCGSGNANSNNKCCTAGVPIGWEDICCAIWCQLCIVGQMARHTVDYSEKKAVCCNSVGVYGWTEDEAYEGVDDGHVGEGSAFVV